VVIWFIFPHFGTLRREKSGNPAAADHGSDFWELARDCLPIPSAFQLICIDGFHTKRGRLGSMLWSQFSAIFDNFRRKLAFFQNPML
jgi:hypothetical protein